MQCEECRRWFATDSLAVHRCRREERWFKSAGGLEETPAVAGAVELAPSKRRATPLPLVPKWSLYWGSTVVLLLSLHGAGVHCTVTTILFEPSQGPVSSCLSAACTEDEGQRRGTSGRMDALCLS